MRLGLQGGPAPHSWWAGITGVPNEPHLGKGTQEWS